MILISIEIILMILVSEETLLQKTNKKTKTKKSDRHDKKK